MLLKRFLSDVISWEDGRKYFSFHTGGHKNHGIDKNCVVKSRHSSYTHFVIYFLQNPSTECDTARGVCRLSLVPFGILTNNALQHRTTKYFKIYFWLRALASVWAIKGKKGLGCRPTECAGSRSLCSDSDLERPLLKSFLILLLGSPSLLVHSHCIRSPVLSTSQSHFTSPFENSFQIICSLTRSRECC